MAMSSRKFGRSRLVNDDIDAITPCPLPTRSSISTAQDSGATSPVSPISPATKSSTSPINLRSARSVSPSSGSSVYSSNGEENAFVSGRRRESVKALEEGTNGDPARLWKRMLALQQTFGCYHSARMDAALSSGDASLLLPSKACLDLMNEHMTLLPDEANSSLERWLDAVESEKHQ